MFAKIYRPSKTAMQSGRAKSQHWLLEFEPSQAKRPDPLMGWSQGGDTRRQIHLKFETKEEAIAYAQRYGIPFQVRDARETPRKIKPYAANFSYDRKVPWSH
ncbi:ETC complex I subunit [Marinicauda algicola]|uniref:ETC complex I subunit n=1 Tax=Marinicauda algicola TaxID=2029849 RepID=A0A4S2GXT0_9PROT|nr:ETC complex I subunit [Marinicauda algicola]TGY87957.1 ETC complex I subunit [Marinicauda algicola]